MDLSNDVLVLLNRCTKLNCIYEGQSFSRKAFSAAFGEPERSELAVKEMVDKGLVEKTPTGSYSLTSIGAAARMAAAAAAAKQGSPRKYPQSRAPSFGQKAGPSREG